MIKYNSKAARLFALSPYYVLAAASFAASTMACGDVILAILKYLLSPYIQNNYGAPVISNFAFKALFGLEGAAIIFGSGAFHEYHTKAWQQKLIRKRKVNMFDQAARRVCTAQAIILKGTVAALSATLLVYTAKYAASYSNPSGELTAVSATKPAARPGELRQANGVYHFENFRP